MMKKILLFIFFISFVCSHLYAQMPKDDDYSKWKWEDQSKSNWQRKLAEGDNWVNIPPPFDPATDKVDLHAEIYRASDYTQAKGWKLIYAKFDRSYPYFILYNPHNSILRTFVYTESADPYTHYAFVLKLKNSTQKVFSASVDPLYPIKNSEFVDVLTTTIQAGLASWAVAEFPMLFDPTVTNASESKAVFEFSFHGCDNFNVNIILDGTAVPLEQAMKDNKSFNMAGSSNAISNTSINANYLKVNSGIQSVEKHLSEMKKYAAKIDSTAAKFLLVYKKTANLVSNASNVVSAIASFSSAIGVVSGIANTIMGLFGNTSTAPVSYKLSATLTGTIDIKKNIILNEIRLPGNPNIDPKAKWQPYNSPMGIVNIGKKPKIRVTTAYRREPSYNYINYTCFPSTYWGAYKKYKFDEDLEIHIQNIEGLELKELRFALLFILDKDGCKEFKIDEEYHSFSLSKRGSSFTEPSIRVKIKNELYTAFEKGYLELYKYDPEDSGVCFGTPYVNLDEIRGAVMEVPSMATVKLGVIATYYSEYYEDYFLFKANYDFEKIEEKAKATRVRDENEQTNFLYSEYFTEGEIELNSLSKEKYTVKTIVLEDGFIGENGFCAEGANYISNGNPKLHTYSYDPYPFAMSYMPRLEEIFKMEEKIEPLQVENMAVKFYPNPAKEWIKIESHGTEDMNVTLQIYDATGKLVKTERNIQLPVYEMNVSDLPRGTYILKLTTDKGNFTERIILN